MHLVFSLEKISSFPGACPPTFSNLFPSLVHTHFYSSNLTSRVKTPFLEVCYSEKYFYVSL
jgi:hypothetical protein